MKYFLCKLIPPRPTFAQDMTDVEAKLMQQHVAYWKGLMDKGLVVVFGPVADPRGTYGVAILELEEEADANAFGMNDPTIKAKRRLSFRSLPDGSSGIAKVICSIDPCPIGSFSSFF